MLLTKEKNMSTDSDVTVRFLSNVLGREAGETATFARTPLVDGLIANGHVKVLDERVVPPEALPEPESAEDPKRRGPRKTDPDPAPQGDPADG